jgi:hypothetical protein
MKRGNTQSPGESSRSQKGPLRNTTLGGSLVLKLRLDAEHDSTVFLFQFGFHNPAVGLCEPGDQVIPAWAVRRQIKRESGTDPRVVSRHPEVGLKQADFLFSFVRILQDSQRTQRPVQNWPLT